MATAKKLTRKSLKRPDEFQQTGRSAVEWLTEHVRLVAIVGSALIVVGVGAAIGLYLHQHRADSAADALGDALAIATRTVTKTPASGQKAFPTKAARAKAYRAALEQVRAKHPGTAAAAEAVLQLGNLDLHQKKYDAAIADYHTYLSEAAPDAPFRFAALEGIGVAHEAKGEKKQALAAYKRLVAQGNAFYRPFALVREARVLVELGRTADARETAQKVLDQYGSSPAKDDAEHLIDSLPAPPPAKDAATPATGGKKQEG